MENPETWNLLTSCLAVSRLKEIDETWAFLLQQGLVASDPEHRDLFRMTVERVLEEGPITGPTEACRIAAALESAGIATGQALEPDPWGSIAKTRAEA